MAEHYFLLFRVHTQFFRVLMFCICHVFHIKRTCNKVHIYLITCKTFVNFLLVKNSVKKVVQKNPVKSICDFFEKLNIKVLHGEKKNYETYCVHKCKEHLFWCEKKIFILCFIFFLLKDIACWIWVVRNQLFCAFKFLI